MNATQIYKTYNEADKAALKQLQDEETARTGKKVSLSDIISAVEPSLQTPDFLK